MAGRRDDQGQPGRSTASRPPAGAPRGKDRLHGRPRLRDEECFLRLDPADLEDYDAATTVSGSSKHGVQVGPDELEEIDLIVSGSVAVTERGARVGKGEGYSDLEYAILREFGFVDDETTVATTVHDRQLLEADVAVDPHDVPMDLLVTPDRVLRPETGEKPAGIHWDRLEEERLEEIPVLRLLDDGQ